MIYFTADTHFGHKNIIDYENRPFANLGEMDKMLIQNWNNIVAPKDTIYHLGDFSFKDPRKYVAQLNGDINLIFGNHDKESRRRSNIFTSCNEMVELNIDGQIIVLCHYEMKSWNKCTEGSWHLYGHSHCKSPESEFSFSFDVGVDCWNYKPISIEDVFKKMRCKKLRV